MQLGDIIQVSSADRYIVKLADEGFGFIGQFVSISTSDETIIGVITDVTHSVKDDMLGYLSQDKKIKYQPYIEDYKESYAIVHGLGRLSDGGGTYSIDKPPHIDDSVKPSPHDEIARFHTVHGRPAAPYLHAMRDRLQPAAILRMIEQLEDAVPDSAGMLRLVGRYAKRGA